MFWGLQSSDGCGHELPINALPQFPAWDHAQDVYSSGVCSVQPQSFLTLEREEVLVTRSNHSLGNLALLKLVWEAGMFLTG